MLTHSEIITFASATDLGRAREFYEHTLGLPCVEQNDFAWVFDANGTMLRVTAASEVAHPGYTILGSRVEDIETAVRELSKKGVRFTRHDGMDQNSHGVWTTPNGDGIAWFTDPDRNNLSLTQFL